MEIPEINSSVCEEESREPMNRPTHMWFVSVRQSCPDPTSVKAQSAESVAWKTDQDPLKGCRAPPAPHT